MVSDLDRQGKPLTTLLCDGCGHVFNDPIPTAEELAAFYARDYRVSYKGAARPRGRQIARNFELIERYWRQWAQMMTNRPRMLDIGAGSGEFLFVAQASAMKRKASSRTSVTPPIAATNWGFLSAQPRLRIWKKATRSTISSA